MAAAFRIVNSPLFTNKEAGKPPDLVSVGVRASDTF